MCEALFEGRHYDRRIAALRFAEEEVDVFGHDHVAHYDEAMALANLLQHLEKQITATGSAEKRPPLVTTGGDEVEISGPVVTVEMGGHSRVVACAAGVRL